MTRPRLPRRRRIPHTLTSFLVAGVLALAGAGVMVLRHDAPASGGDAARSSSAAQGLTEVLSGRPYTLTTGPGRLTLLSFLATQPDTASSPSRSQAVVLKSLATQYGSRGLAVAIVAADPVPAAKNTLVNTAYDWDLRSVALLSDPSENEVRRYGVTTFPTTFLVDGKGTVLARWDGYLLTAKAAAAITPHLDSRA